MVSVPAPLEFQYIARSHIIPLPEVGLLTTPAAVATIQSSAVERVMHEHASMVPVLTALENTGHSGNFKYNILGIDAEESSVAGRCCDSGIFLYRIAAVDHKGE